LREDEAAEVLPGIPGIDRPGAKQEEDVLAKQIGGGAASAPQGGVELRRTLSGEIIEVPVSPAPRTAGPMLGKSGPQSPPPIPTARPSGRPTVPPLRAGSGPIIAGEEAAGKKSSVGIIVTIIVIVLLAGAAAGYWYYMQLRPIAAVTQVIDDINRHNWGAVYDQIELPSEIKGMVTRDVFEKAMSMVGSNLKIEDYKVTSPRIEGDKATVTVTSTAVVGNKKNTSTSDVHLIKVNGVWKIDATGSMPKLPGMKVPGAGGKK